MYFNSFIAERDSKLTASAHFVEILLQKIAKSAHKIFESPTPCSQQGSPRSFSTTFINCGGGGIRTPETLSSLPPFQGGALDHYATPPSVYVLYHYACV